MAEGDGSSDEDCFRILVATDNHLGFLERDSVRGDDSFLSFEEVFQQARKQKVSTADTYYYPHNKALPFFFYVQADFVLLGGDLFHDNRPSRYTMYRATQLFRKYCLGDGPIGFQVTFCHCSLFIAFVSVSLAILRL